MFAVIGCLNHFSHRFFVHNHYFSWPPKIKICINIHEPRIWSWCLHQSDSDSWSVGPYSLPFATMSSLLGLLGDTLSPKLLFVDLQPSTMVRLLQNSLRFKSSYDLILGLFIVVMFFTSWLALGEEMKLDMQRIWKRNLGRDDRCISDNGKEVWLYNFSWVILMCCNCMDSCSTFRPDSHS